LNYLKLQEVSTHNLKGFNLDIPLNTFVVITGPSGSGKSSLAFDTIAQLGKEKLLQILNYDKEFFPLSSIKAKLISSLPPVIGLSQGIKEWYPYKTFGEFLFIVQFLETLFIKWGEYKCFGCGYLNKISSFEDTISYYKTLKNGTRFYFLLPVFEYSPKALEYFVSQGYTKFFIDGKEIDLSEEEIPSKFKEIYLILDRMIKDEKSIERFVENLRLSLSLNQGRIVLKLLDGESKFFNLKTVCLKCGNYLFTKWYKCKQCNGLGYKERIPCKACKGLKFDNIVLASKLFGKEIREILKFDLKEFKSFLKENKKKYSIPEDWLNNIFYKLELADFLGLSDIPLSTPVFKLSLGQRKLLEILLIFGINFTQCLYVLDEPSLGLDLETKEKLLKLISRLIKNGNSVIVVEHDPYILSKADFIIELGPEGGEKGGYLIKAENSKNYFKNSHTITLEYLKGKKKIKSINLLYKGNILNLKIREHEISIYEKGINLIFGKVGSKKNEIFEEIKKHLKTSGESILEAELPYKNSSDFIINYTGIWKDLREILINLPEAKIKGLNKRYFSFSTKEGVCNTCKGRGYKILEGNKFNVEVICEDCLGKRLNREVLNLSFKGFKIFEILDFTVEEALRIFENIFSIKKKLLFLKELGLGYLKLSQEIRHLSGGEKIRINLAKKLLSKGNYKFIFLEYPLQGFHFKDIENFIKWLKILLEKQVTFIILETNPFAIFLANFVIEISQGKPLFQGFIKDWLKELKRREKKLYQKIEYYKKFFDLKEV